jgi:hypothetical protein
MEEEGTSLLEWIRDVGPWIISLLALVQVWVIEAWKRFRPGKTEIYEKEQIEVGYSSLGPAIALYGTIRSVHKDVFVSSVTLTVTRLKDNATIDLEWLAFRPKSMSIYGDKDVELEMASGFMLRTSDPKQFNIIFTNEDFLEEHKSTIDQLRANWWQFRQERLSEIFDNQDSEDAKNIDHQALNEALFEEYSNTGGNLDFYTALNQSFFWQPGEYRVGVDVKVAKPNKSEHWDFEFTLSADDSEGLRQNAIPSIREALGLPHNYHFAFPKITRADEKTT